MERKCEVYRNQYGGQEHAVCSPVLNLVELAVLWRRTITYTQQRLPMETEISDVLAQNLTQPHILCTIRTGSMKTCSSLPPELTLLAGPLQDDLSRGREVHH